MHTYMHTTERGKHDVCILNLCRYVGMHVCMHACIYVCMYVYTRICTYVDIYIYTCVYNVCTLQGCAEDVDVQELCVLARTLGEPWIAQTECD